MALSKKVRVARNKGRQQQWWFRKRAGELNEWPLNAIKYDRPDELYRKSFVVLMAVLGIILSPNPPDGGEGEQLPS